MRRNWAKFMRGTNEQLPQNLSEHDGQAVESNLSNVLSDSIQKVEACEERGVGGYEIVNLTSEQIEAYDLTHEVTAEELYRDIENACFTDGLEQFEKKQVVVSSAPLKSVTLPIQV